MSDSIVDLIVSLLNNEYINPYQGSVCIEKIISILKYKYNDMYNLHVECKYKKFTDFLKSYPEYFTIITNEKNTRIILTNNMNWKHADNIEEKTKQYYDNYLEYQIINHLATYGSDYVDNIMCNIYFTIKRGDFARFIKRRKNIFIFNDTLYVVSLNNQFNVDNFNKKYYKDYYDNCQC